MEAKTEWKIGEHTLRPQSLGTWDKCPQPRTQIAEFDLGLGGGTKMFFLRDQTTGDLKSHHLQARATLTAMSLPPRPPFFLQKGNPLSTWKSRYYYAIPYILAISYNARKNY